MDQTHTINIYNIIFIYIFYFPTNYITELYISVKSRSSQAVSVICSVP